MIQRIPSKNALHNQTNGIFMEKYDMNRKNASMKNLFRAY